MPRLPNRPHGRSLLASALVAACTPVAPALAQVPDTGAPPPDATAVPDDASPREAPSAAADDTPPPSAAAAPRAPTAVRLPNGHALEVGCSVRIARRIEASIYVLCEDGRLLWVDTIDPYVEEVAVRGTAVDLFERNGSLWVELVRHEALALDPELPGPIVSSATAPATAAPRDPEPRRAAPDYFSPYRPPPPRDRRSRSARDRDLPRFTGWAVTGHLRPFIGEDGGGATLTLAVTHVSEAPLYVRGEIDPIGIAHGSETARSFNCAAAVGFDHEVFGLGVGLGTMYVDLLERDRFARGLAVSLLQEVRLGERDETHVAIQTAFAVFDGETSFAELEALMRVDVADNVWFVAQGGGDIGRRYWGELGARVWLTPSATDRRGVYVTPALGGVSLGGGAGDSIGGLALTLGLEVRP